jgi:hypothetical protein
MLSVTPESAPQFPFVVSTKILAPKARSLASQDSKIMRKALKSFPHPYEKYVLFLKKYSTSKKRSIYNGAKRIAGKTADFSSLKRGPLPAGRSSLRF